MPDLNFYKQQLGNKKVTIGQAHKHDSDMIMENTWDRDIDSRVGWFYDQEHDDEFDVEIGLHPEKSRTKIPVDIKLFEMEYNSLSKDETAYHIMFKPSYKPNIPYYDDKFAKPYGAHYPIGLYFDAKDSNGIYRRWLVVGQYREYSNQFPTYLVLPTDFKLQWVHNQVKYQSWCVLRSQNSYNAGVWESYKFVLPENQKIIWLPTNNITKTIFYDQRIAISVEREIPVVWSCTKVEETNVKGISRFTMKQDLYDEHKDFIEHDEEGNLVGIWCDYFYENLTPEDPNVPKPQKYANITFSGLKQELKIGGSYKKFTVNFFNGEEETPYEIGTWKFELDGQDASSLITILTHQDSKDVDENQIKVKFHGDDSYIGKTLLVKFESYSGINAELKVPLVGV